ncbi:hypothetical protein ACH4VM_33580 [Streptomyces sp. NPDC020792]|uniref:hypothetical protein n=1 Tax=Streptomyces sp. NPDC020792 TaxID=3365089 RepID=UPI0037BAF2CB
MATDERLITRTDYQRVYALLQAYRIRDLDNSQLLWEILHDIHQEQLHDQLDPEDVVGDEGVAREAHHAAIVMEALLRGKDTIRSVTRPPMGVCGTPGCPETTYSALCPACELKNDGM